MKTAARIIRLSHLVTLLGVVALICPGDIIAQEKVIISGTGSSIAFMKLLGDAFMKKHPKTLIEVLPSIGSTGGIKAVSDRRITIGLSSRPLKQAERRSDLIEEIYGRTPLVFATHRSTPSKGISLTEIEEIFAGKRQAWPDGLPLRLVLRPVSDAYTTAVAEISPAMKVAIEKSQSIPGVFIGMTDHDAAQHIERTPGSFGVTSACIIASEKIDIRALPLEGVAPTSQNLSSGRYPYGMTMSIVYLKDSYRGVARSFIDFIFSPAGQKLIDQYGHVAQQRTR